MTNSSISKTACPHYARSDLVRYLSGELSSDATDDFEVHANDCPSCLRGLHAEEQSRLAEINAREDRALLSRTKAIMDRLDGNLLSVVVKAGRNLLQLIETSGVFLDTTPLAHAVRSSQGNTDATETSTLRIQQEFDAPPLSVEAVLSARDVGVFGLSLSLFDRQNESFLQGAEVTLSDERMSTSQQTDEGGQVQFMLPHGGRYILQLYDQQHFLGNIVINFWTGEKDEADGPP